MKLGFVTAILPELTLDQVLEFAAGEGPVLHNPLRDRAGGYQEELWRGLISDDLQEAMAAQRERRPPRFGD